MADPLITFWNKLWITAFSFLFSIDDNTLRSAIAFLEQLEPSE